MDRWIQARGGKQISSSIDSNQRRGWTRFNSSNANTAAWGFVYAMGVLTGLVTAVYTTDRSLHRFVERDRARGASTREARHRAGQ